MFNSSTSSQRKFGGFTCPFVMQSEEERERDGGGGSSTEKTFGYSKINIFQCSN